MTQPVATGPHSYLEIYRAAFEALWAHATDAIALSDPAGRVIAANPAYFALYGLSPEEVIGQSFAIIFPEEQRPLAEAQYQRLFAAPEVESSIEVTIRRKDGSERLVESRYHFVIQDGQRIAMVSVVRDLTDYPPFVAIRESQRQLAQAQALAHLGSWEWDIPRNVVSWSDELYRIYGLAPQSVTITYEDYLARIHPEDRALVDQIVQNAYRTGCPFEFDHRIVLPDGQIRIIHAQGEVVLDTQGQPIRMMGTGQDVTAARRAEAEIRALNEQLEQRVAERTAELAEAHAATARQRDYLESLFRQAPAVINILRGPEHIFEFFHPLARRVTGGRDLAGQKARAVLTGPLGATYIHYLDLAYQTGESVSVKELRVPLEDAEGRPYERFYNIVFTPWRDARGAIGGVMTFAVDVTEQVRARQAVEELARAARAAEQRWRSVIDGIADAILVVSPEGRFVDVNPAATALLGYSREELLALPVGRLTSRANGVEWARAQVAQTFRDRQWQGEGELRHKDGRLIPIEGRAHVIDLADGPVAITVLRDISTRKRLEQQRSAMISALSHDLKNPLTTIKAMAYLVRRRLARLNLPDLEDIIQQLQMIDQKSGQIVAMLNEMVDLTRAEQGVGLELERQPLDLVALARRVVEESQRSTDHPLIWECALEELTGEWDPERLERVLANLLSNAIKYSPEGGPVTVRLWQEDRNGCSWATLAIQDQGIGIPDDELPRIFEPYFRGRQAAGQFEGAGIGLASVRQTVEQHGGTVMVESTLGQGTTFTVRLPLQAPAS